MIFIINDDTVTFIMHGAFMHGAIKHSIAGTIESLWDLSALFYRLILNYEIVYQTISAV